MQTFTLDFKRNKYIYLYYLFLHLVCLSWTNIGMVAPSSLLRIVVTFAVFAPLAKYIWMAPAVIILFVGLRFNSVAPFGYIPQSWQIFEFIIIIVWLINRIFFKKNSKNCFTRKQIVLFLFLFLVDLFNFQPFSPIFLFVLMLYILYDCITNRTQLNLALFSFIILTITLSIYYFVYAKEFTASYYGSEAERAMWIDPNYFGVVLGVGVIIAGGYIFSAIKMTSNVVYKIIFIVSIILGFMVIALQASRGAMLAVASALIVQMLFSSAKWYHKFIFILFTVLGIIYLFQSNYFTLLIDRTLYGTGDSGRSSIWISKLTEWSENTFNLLGTGYGASVVKFTPYNYDCHNEFVSILINYGILGIVVVLKEIVTFITIYRNKSFICSVVAFLICSFMTLSPVTTSTGWTACPLLILLLYKFCQLEKRGEY